MFSLLALIPVCVLALAGVNRFAPSFAFRLMVKIGRYAAGLRERRIEVHGQSVPYLVGGRGAPLLLVHGFTASKETFSDISRFLTPHFRVYALDLPGFGDATRAQDADYSMEAQVEHVHAFIQSLGLGKVHAGGNSMGGGIVALLAGTYPQDVASVWLIDAAATQEAAQSAMVLDFVATGEFPLLNKRPEDYADRWQYVFGKPRFIPYAYNRTMGVMQAGDYALHKKILSVIQSSRPIEQRYADLQVPALIVTGAEDRIVPPNSVYTLARVFPNSRIKVMPGLGHIPMVEAPGRTAGDYLEFRQGLGDAK